MRKLEFAQALADRLGLTERQGIQVVDEVLELLSDAFMSGQEVYFRNLGRFSVHEKKSRMGRNPRTGEQVPVEASRTVRFRASSVLRARVTAAKF